MCIIIVSQKYLTLIIFLLKTVSNSPHFIDCFLLFTPLRCRKPNALPEKATQEVHLSFAPLLATTGSNMSISGLRVSWSWRLGGECGSPRAAGGWGGSWRRGWGRESNKIASSKPLSGTVCATEDKDLIILHLVFWEDPSMTMESMLLHPGACLPVLLILLFPSTLNLPATSTPPWLVEGKVRLAPGHHFHRAL